MGNKTCNKCNMRELGWDYNYNKRTGRWKLEDHKRKDGKWCNKLSIQLQETPIKKGDIEKCKLCLGNSGWLLSERGRERHPKWYSLTPQEHKNMFHPNNEILNDVNFMILTDEERLQIKNEFRT